MNIDELRWMLTGCGIILVAGIYVWERFRRKRTGDRERDLRAESDPRVEAFSLQTEADRANRDMDLPSMRNEPFDPLFSDGSTRKSEAEIKARNAADQESSESNDPFGIVQIKVTSREGMCFSGNRLINALSSVGLEYGAMNIFHKQQDGRELPLFSVVNLVEPGTFPVDDPSHFESPGVVFFLQLAVSQHPLPAFDEMVRTVHILAARIGGEIRDADNKLLTVEKTEAIRRSLQAVAG